MHNPYAPPTNAAFALHETALPEGMRRYRLAKDAYWPLVRRILLRRYAIVFVVYAGLLGILAGFGRSSVLSAVIVLVVWAVGFSGAWFRSRSAAGKHVALYEVIVSPRVARRIMFGLGPAEVLRPEVTRIVETPVALWLVCRFPRRVLAFVRAVDGYDALRSELSTWGSLETLRGWSAWAFAYGQLRHMRPRDNAAEGALASDPSLHEELSMVRGVSADRGAGYGPAQGGPSRLRRLFVLWVLLLVIILAIWQLLAPAERPAARRPARPAPSASAPGATP